MLPAYHSCLNAATPTYRAVEDRTSEVPETDGDGSNQVSIMEKKTRPTTVAKGFDHSPPLPSCSVTGSGTAS